jgi:mono/diheme cytochrome c family protein
MRRREWSAIAASLAIVVMAACAGGDDTANDTPADTLSAAPPTTPATPPGGGGTPAPGTPPAGATAEMLASGQQTFGGICMTCHGADAKGTQLAPNLTDSEWINVDGTYDAIINVVKTGVPTPKQAPAAMPPMGGAQLSDEQVRAVAAYVWSLGGGK